VRDVGMIEGGEHLRFALEARQSLGVVRDRAQPHFDRDVAIQLPVARARYTAPMPPSPSEETISKGPGRVPEVRLMDALDRLMWPTPALDSTPPAHRDGRR